MSDVDHQISRGTQWWRNRTSRSVLRLDVGVRLSKKYSDRTMTNAVTKGSPEQIRDTHDWWRETGSKAHHAKKA